ncbi:hypothetical protein [Nocardia jejuensis]|nr:hypothetical protein [Nocardia jejuensis]
METGRLAFDHPGGMRGPRGVGDHRGAPIRVALYEGARAHRYG